MALNDKQEKFAQAYILHQNATVAAKEAGYSGSSEQSFATQGHRLLGNQEVKERIAELESTLETSVDVITEIEKQYEFAKANGHTNSAIKALELLSRVRGNKNEKEIDMSPEGLETTIIENLQILGRKKVMELVDRCDFTLPIKLDTEQHQQHQEKTEEEHQE